MTVSDLVGHCQVPGLGSGSFLGWFCGSAFDGELWPGMKPLRVHPVAVTLTHPAVIYPYGIWVDFSAISGDERFDWGIPPPVTSLIEGFMHFRP